jgi:hypothetical protein
MASKRELQEENEQLRGKLEEAYDVIGEALGFDEDETDSEEDGESDASDLDDEE